MSASTSTRVFSVALRTWLVSLLILGVMYPLGVTLIARAAFPDHAGGSVITSPDGTVRGSALIGQEFSSDRYFHGRPSAAGDGYDAMASGGSNLGPTSAELASTLRARAKETLAREPGLEAGTIPADMIAASASGLDPDISPANALAQVPRVARARGMAARDLRALVLSSVRGRDLGFVGEPRVNVLELNLALDAIETP
jgi:K+-transporting ATPase ATPase C chain